MGIVAGHRVESFLLKTNPTQPNPHLRSSVHQPNQPQNRGCYNVTPTPTPNLHKLKKTLLPPLEKPNLSFEHHLGSENRDPKDAVTGPKLGGGSGPPNETPTPPHPTHPMTRSSIIDVPHLSGDAHGSLGMGTGHSFPDHLITDKIWRNPKPHEKSLPSTAPTLGPNPPPTP